VAHLEQVGLLEQAVDDFAPARLVRDALQLGEMVEQFLGA
jgi:hypothetical protein